MPGIAVTGPAGDDKVLDWDPQTGDRMSGLLPSTPDTSKAEEAEPRVIGVDSDSADDLLAAMSSATARRILATLHDEPTTPSAIADDVDTSLQNVQYHLGRLEDADLVEVIDTIYSEKGREMNVYAPTDRPLVFVAGPQEDTTTLKSALTTLLSGVGILAVLSLAVQTALEGFPFFTSGDGAGASPDVEMAAAPSPTPTPSGGGISAMEATQTPVETAAAQATGGLFPEALPPGVLFFAGGVVILLLGFAVWYARAARRT